MALASRQYCPADPASGLARAGADRAHRPVILKARRLVHDDAERENAGAALKTLLLAQIEKKRALSAGDSGGCAHEEPFATERLAA